MDPNIQGGAIGLLAVAVITLWRMLSVTRAKQDEEHAACKKENATSNARIHKLEIEQELFHSCAADPCPAKQAILRAQQFNSEQTHTK